jgi:hypothetical protein
MFFLLGVIILLITLFIAWLLKFPAMFFGGCGDVIQIKELALIQPSTDLEREQYLYIYSDLSNVFRHKIFKLRSVAEIHSYIRSKLRAEFDEADYEQGKQAYELIKKQYSIIEVYDKSHIIRYLNVAHTIEMLIKPPKRVKELIEILLTDNSNIEYCDRSLYNLLNFWERSFSYI